MASTDQRARDLGFATPAATDLIRQGDNAISQNARATVDLFDVAILASANLGAQAHTLEPTEQATADVTGPYNHRVISIGVPRGERGIPGMGYAEGLALTQAAANSEAAADLAADRAEVAEAAAYNIPDVAMKDILNNPLTAFRQALPAAVSAIETMARRAPGVRYSPVVGVIRKTSGVWAPIDDAGHTPTGVASIEANTARIRIHFDHTATKVGTLLCNVDEAYAAEGYHIGASVAVGWADLYIYKRLGSLGGYVAYDGANWTGSPAGMLRNFAWSGNTLTIEHDSVKPAATNLMVSVTGRGPGNYIYRVGSISATVTRVEVYNLDGTPVTTPTNSMRFYVMRGSDGLAPVDPLTMPEGTANLWFLGFNEITHAL